MTALPPAPGGATEPQTAPHGGVVRGATLLVSGTVIGQLAVLASSPFLTRLYGPSDFGTLAVYSAILAAVTLIASLRFELAVPLPDRREDGIAVLALSLLVLAGTTILTVIAVLLLRDEIAVATSTPQLAPLLWLLPVGVLFGGMHKCLTYWSLRERDFAVIAGTRWRQGVGMSVAQAGLGALGFGAEGLLVGHIVGVAAGLANLTRSFVRQAGAALHAVVMRDLKAMALRYRDFAIFSTWSDVANVLGGQIPFVIFAARYSPSVAGLYLLAHRVANAPAVLVSEAVGKAFMTGAVDARGAGTLPGLALDVFALLLRLGTGPLLIVSPFMPMLFAWAFGDPWREAGHFVQAIVPWMACVVVFAPLTSLFSVLERQRAELAFQVTLLVVRIGALLAGAALGGALLAVTLYSLGATVVYTGFGWWLLRTSGVEATVLRRRAIEEVRVSAALGAISFAAAFAVQDPSASVSGFRITGVSFVVAALLALSVRRILAGLRTMRSSIASRAMPERA